MLSRGKRLVKLALKGQVSDTNNEQDTIRDENNNEKDLLDESDFYYFDDDVKDPDFVPPNKRKRQAYS